MSISYVKDEMLGRFVLIISLVYLFGNLPGCKGLGSMTRDPAVDTFEAFFRADQQ